MADSANQSNNEHSIGSCYTVVYDFDETNRTWKVAGNGGWSELHICHDKQDESFRILAWTHDNQEVLVNVNLDDKCEYKEKSENFHSFKDKDSLRRGFGFHKSTRNLESAKDFLRIVQKTLTELRRKAHNHKDVGERTKSIVATVPTLSEGVRSKPPERQPDGTLLIHDPCDAKLIAGDVQIDNPDRVQHTSHVEFDKETGKYIFHGKQPEGFQAMANQQFAVPPKKLPSVVQLDPCKHDGNYDAKIPFLLTKLKDKLFELGGLKEKGIFRLAPDAGECSEIKKMINMGEAWEKATQDVNVIANLIKVWFRDLPNPLLNCIESKHIEQNQTVEKVANSIQYFDEPFRSLLLWLWDFCVEVAKFSDQNKMGIQNLGIVIGPNLFDTSNFDNPMKAMDFSGKVVTYFQKGIEWRKNSRKTPLPDINGVYRKD